MTNAYIEILNILIPIFKKVFIDFKTISLNIIKTFIIV